MTLQKPFIVTNAEIEVLTAAREQGFSVSFRTWDRIRDLVRALPGPERVAGHLAWASIETAVGAALALIPWTAVYATLEPKAHADFAWITPALVILLLFSLALSALSFWFDHSKKGELERSAGHICDDMDDIARPFRPPAQEAPTP